MTGRDVCQTLVCDLHATVQFQHRQILRDGSACTQGSYTFVRDPSTVGHALNDTNKLSDTLAEL